SGRQDRLDRRALTWGQARDAIRELVLDGVGHEGGVPPPPSLHLRNDVPFGGEHFGGREDSPRRVRPVGPDRDQIAGLDAALHIRPHVAQRDRAGPALERLAQERPLVYHGLSLEVGLPGIAHRLPGTLLPFLDALSDLTPVGALDVALGLVAEGRGQG